MSNFIIFLLVTNDLSRRGKIVAHSLYYEDEKGLEPIIASWPIDLSSLKWYILDTKII